MRRLVIAFVLAVLAGPVLAHQGVRHADRAAAADHEQDAPTPFPVALGGPYRLIDQTGAVRTERDPEGRLQLVFFGYANCPSICPTALARMVEMADLAAARGVRVAPVLITVDPARDTPETIGAGAAQWGPELIGLTGDAAALAAARKAFQVETKVLFVDPETGPVYAHGALIYLLDAEGTLLTVLPPIISVERGVDLVAKYAAAG